MKSIEQLNQIIAAAIPESCGAVGKGQIVPVRANFGSEYVRDVSDYLRTVSTDRSLRLHPKRGAVSGNNNVEIPFIPIQTGVFGYGGQDYISLVLVRPKEETIRAYLVLASQWDKLNQLPGIQLTDKQWRLLRRAIPLISPQKQMWQRKEIPFDRHGSHIAQENAKAAMSTAMSPAAGLDGLEGMPPGVIQIDSASYADEICQLVRAMDMHCAANSAARPHLRGLSQERRICRPR